MSLLKLFWNICLFRQGPQDIPASTFLLRLLIILYAIVNSIILLLESGWQIMLLQLPLQLVLMTGFFWGLLRLYNQQKRYPQTISALLGCDVLISLCAFPPLIWMITVPTNNFSFLLMLGIMVWQLAVIGHIVRQALSQHFYFAIGLAVVYVILSFKIMQTIFALLT